MAMETRTGVNRKNHADIVRPREARASEPVLLRRELGDVLRAYRQRQGRTLREVSSDARVSLGYLSEVERGQKEASSELLLSITQALNVPLGHVLRLVADRIDLSEGRVPPSFRVPDTVQEALAEAGVK
ncbi:XRE family transcriptional regulator [Flaviflexus salsibiostraticola]|uniref:XRE family transcriptional regulator n=1 Tax=Flaviflexus salsibiostraticola TaxID=1282737 RepID=A0A3S8Z5Z6_9ACTO|nr:helix-turn-helix transcriptional regulator [Flaviflexus salsibiostraticola]AZN28917.1 XRE family transcriptional regulator [Flaviflexus salsibiostraticola]